MFEFLKNIFIGSEKKKTKKMAQIIPGDVWWSSEIKKNPFDSASWSIEIKAVKDGWVNYKFSPGIVFQNESLEESSFRNCYQPNKP